MANDSKGQGITPDIAEKLLGQLSDQLIREIERCLQIDLRKIANAGKENGVSAMPPFVTHSGSSALDHSGGGSWSLLNRFWKMLRGGRHTRIQ